MKDDNNKKETLTQESVIRDLMRALQKKDHEVSLLKAKEDELIAIIGMACRLPGNVNNPEDYWKLLIENKDGIIDVPSNRWNLDQYYDPDKDAPGKMYVKKGGFLQIPVDEFDADFFHISPKEAEDMDPQQRLALEVAVEAIQSAGINSTDLMRSLTGVYMGICFNDYGHLITESGHVEAVDNYYSTGNHYSVLSGRISYFFGLQGPAISMDTACSSSLVSIDTAVKDLRLKRCNLALAGGVNLMLAPEPTINFCKSGMLSPEGHCKTFDESADGYVRGEGCGIIVLKRLSDAIKDNNTILAVIRGTAVNQDGPSSGLTVPNGLAQEAVIKSALENAKVSPIEIQYVEAHGTGTSLGDPIEVEALKNSYTEGRDKNHPLRVGSVKTNIGHTEAVAGVASIMKVVLSLLHEKIPATLHFKKLNPKIVLDQAPLEIASQNIDWKREENAKRLAGVSSFGFSGTNAHIILEEGPALSAEQLELWLKRTEEKPEFHRQAYWAEAARPSAQQTGIYVHPLLGEMHNLPDKTAYFSALLQISTLSYLEDHVVFDRVIYPGAAYLEMALAAGTLLLGKEKATLENVTLESVLQFEAGKPKKTQMLLKKFEAETYAFEIYSQVQHAKGKISAEMQVAADISLETLKNQCPETLSVSQFYEAIKAKGIAYGPHFQCIQHLYKGNKEVLAELQLKGSSKGYHMHPALLDCALQLVFANFSENGQFNLPAVLLPISCEKLEMYSDLGEKIWAHLSLLESTESITIADIKLLNFEGRLLANIKGFHYRPTSLSALENVLEGEKKVEAPSLKKIAKTDLVLELESAEATQRLSIVKNYLKDLVRRILGKSPSELIEDNKGFFEMGFDSMMVVEFEEHLEDALGKGHELPSSLLFDRPNIEKMTEYLAEILKIETPPTSKKVEVQAPLSIGEPIAIIGMSCRFPGGANSVDEYWGLLERGEDAIREIPKNRWDADNYFDPDPEAPGKMISKLGGFLNIDISEFDADFFGISPREAEFLDPQQRLLLEVSYEALQSTGLDPLSLRESLTSVYVGICTQDYMDLLTATGDKTLISPYLATGNMASTASGRLSYFYGFQGPNFPIDTACSSSLVAIHQACESLRNGEANLALAGGVNLILAPDLNIDFSKAGMLASDGHCKTFDAKADGYVRGEGCGIIVLKRLSEAERDGNTILAVIKASSVNQDGASSGLTVPNGDAQEKLIRKVISKAQLKASDVDYIEAHGTGTSLGDPIEVRAIGATYGERDSKNPLKLGSVKTNIGHLEGAAGIASVIKVILALQHEMLPKHLHFTKLNPHIDLNFPAEIVTENKKWKRGERIRRAAVSSFGFSGTNAHLILEEGPALSEVEKAQLQERFNHLPNFKRQRYWAEAALPSVGKRISAVHPLLGEKYSTPDEEIIYRGELHLGTLPYLKDHQVYGHIIYPGAGYLEMMLAATLHGLGEGKIQLNQVSIEAALSFDAGKSVETQVIMKSLDAGYELAVYSQAQDASAENASWHSHAKGTVSISEFSDVQAPLEIEAIKKRCKRIITQKEFYEHVNSTRIFYGEHFQALKKIHVGKEEALGELSLSDSTKAYLAHPALLDGALQLLAVSPWKEKSKDLYLPVGCDAMEFYAPLGDSVLAYWQETEKTEMGRSGNLSFCTADGKILALIKGMHYRKTTEHALKQMLAHEGSIGDWLYEWNWEEKSLEVVSAPDPLGHWLVLSDGPVSGEFVKLFENKGATIRRISSMDHPKTKEAFIELLKSENFNGILHAASTGAEEILSGQEISKAQHLGAESVLHLTQALVEIEETQKIPLFLITHGLVSELDLKMDPAIKSRDDGYVNLVLASQGDAYGVINSPLLGFFKTTLAEHPELALKLIDLDSDFDSNLIFQAIFAKDNETLLSLRNHRCYAPRFLKLRDAKLKRHELIRPVDDEFRLQSKQKGLLENLTLGPLELKENLGPHEVEVEVRAVGLNFRDVLDALGLYPGDPGPLGGDASGIITRVGESVKDLRAGDAVLGMISGSLSRRAQTHRDTIAIKPENLDFENAAALPTVFLTAYYAFTRSTVLKKGETVLIHAGAGGVGQAAIQLAKHVGANIIVTAGDTRKHEFLKSQGIEHIFDSRSLSYGKDIEALTKGEGVDVVLNSLSGEGFIETTLKICKKDARFLEIGKRNIWTKEAMNSQRPDIDYHIIALDDISQTNPDIIQAMLKELMPLFEKGTLKPLPITSFPIENAIQAFEYMQAAKHIGKVVIEIPPAPSIENKIQGNATYLITGGLGGLGITLAKWLSEKGATHLVLTGRRALDDEMQAILKNLETSNTKVTYESLDIGDEKSVENLLSRLGKNEKPLKGIFHLAGILDDATLMEQDWNHFEKVFRPKVYGSFYLHQYSKNLDLFVMFSSIASSLGSPGQANYSAANAFMDALCEYRKKQGLPAHSLSWGPWAEVGMAKALVSRHAKGGLLGLKPKEGMRALEAALLSNEAHITIANIHWKNYLKTLIEVPSWLEAFATETSSKDLLSAQLEAVPANERVALVKSYVTEVLRSVLGLSAYQAIDEKKGFFDMGLDSLMAIELKNRLQVGLGKAAILATTAVFDHSSIEKMTNYLGQLLKIESLQVRKKEETIISIQPDEPIAIIGMSCRFPGGANNIEEYWKLLERGGDAIREVPATRWDANSYYDPDPSAPGKMITKLGGFLDVDVSEFDAGFFKISPKEAEYLDPQQRLLLEVSYEAIKSAGIDQQSLENSETGVFIGICSHDYMDLITAAGETDLINPYMATGNVASTATGRISYFFGLEGPNFAVDTACSSSLVAINQACESLQKGDANLALTGGVNLILAPNLSIDFSKAGMLALDGHCKTFDASADGYVRGEGCGIIVLKRLSDAQRDGNTILAVIKASSVNQDGASSGLTVPNGDAQEKLIRRVIGKAELKGADIDYLEAHGTGTSLGDPIEVRAIGATYGERDSEHPLKLGSVKTNIGHLEGAAGIASVIKVILALQHEMLPKHLHFTKLNPHIDMNFPAEIVTENKEWKRGERIRRAAVSSFGFSGTNAHLILEEGPPLSEVELSKFQERFLNLPQFKRQRYWPKFLDDNKEKTEKVKIESWFYRVEWIETPISEKQKLKPSFRRYLVFGNQATTDMFFGGNQSESIFVRDREQFNDDKINNSITDVVYFGNFDNACEGLLNVIQNIVKAGLTPRMWILTQCAQSVTGNEINFNPLQSQLLGFGKVIGLEHPEFHCVRIDYDSSFTAKLFLEELKSDGKEDEVAIREGKRYVSRLDAYFPQKNRNISISAEHAYLITGGLGGLGLNCAGWLIDKGAKKLILTARSKPKDAVQNQLNQYREEGVEITIIQGDINKKNDVIALFEFIKEKSLSLKGIIHAAGVADNDFIMKQNWERFSKVLAPKVDGTQNIDELLKLNMIELDFYVLFSSISGVLGSASTSSYAAANYYLDQYAQYAQKQGLPAISLAWGPWAELGMAAGERERELRLGYGLIYPKDGLKAMEMALEDGGSSFVIAPMNWFKYFNNLQYVAKIYSLIEVAQVKPAELKKDELGLLLEKTEPEDRRTKTSEYVCKTVREVLGLDKAEIIDDKKGFFEMGMDSILATNLRNELQRALGDRCTLTSTLTFDYPNVEKVVDYILIQSGFGEIMLEDDANKELARQSQVQKEFESKIENASEEDLMEELQRQIEREEKNE